MSHKRILAILGSPRKMGITSTMLNHAMSSAEKAGYEVTKINLYEKQIAYCNGCGACLSTEVCIQQDDIVEIASLIKECDTIILAAPAYWANVPASVKNLFDRLRGTAMESTSTFPKPRLLGKNYMLLTACNTPSPFSWICGQSRGVIRNADEFFKTAGMKCIGKFVCANTSKINELPKSLVNRIERCLK